MLRVTKYPLQLLNIGCYRFGLKRAEFLIACFFLCLGMAVRTRNYLAGASLWNDEAALAGNLLAKPLSALFGPLDVGQIAPIGFCLVEWLSIQFLGDNELSLRLIPFAAGVAVLPLAFLFTRRVLGPFCFLLGVSFFWVFSYYLQYRFLQSQTRDLYLFHFPERDSTRF